MPLSEREQRILEEIEKHLYEEDPELARGIAKRRFNQAKLGALLFVAGFVVLIAFFVARAIVLGVLAFGAMVAGIVLVASSLHSLLPDSRRPVEQISRFFGRWEQRLRQRNKHD